MKRFLALVLLSFAVALLAPEARASNSPTVSPVCGPAIAATISVGSNVTFVWVAPTTYQDGTTISGTVTYNLYNVTTPTPVLLLGGITGLTTTRTNLSLGSPCYALTAEVNGVESGLTTGVLLSVVEIPNPPTTVTCTITLPASAGATATAVCVTK